MQFDQVDIGRTQVKRPLYPAARRTIPANVQHPICNPHPLRSLGYSQFPPFGVTALIEIKGFYENRIPLLRKVDLRTHGQIDRVFRKELALPLRLYNEGQGYND